MASFLDGLNDDQLLAVTSPPQGQLQIVAGPGTGKTRVIAARVAHLIVNCHLPPSSIVVTTFTKKAANEMRERIARLLDGYPDINVKSILMGTFHSICFRIIVVSGYKDYTIANERDAKALLTDAANSVPSQNDEKDDIRKIRRVISSLKANATCAETYSSNPKKDVRIALIYAAYQARLTAARRLDFDDCLLVCLQILRAKQVLPNVRHVLVDEFQDTNIIQLHLMYAFAHANNVTVVGDPDQGIYAFRDACASNFAAMRLNYSQCAIVELSRNYRLTPAIVGVAETIMRQQQGRAPRSVTATTSASFAPVLFQAHSSTHEARWTAQQIARLAAAPGLCNYSDIAILVRSSHQTRALESALVASKIPYVMVKGMAFWDRREVVAILDYMRLVASERDDDRLALQRAINYPKRGIGEKAWQTIARELDLRPGQKLCEILPSACASLGAKAAGTVRDFVAMIKKARSLLSSGSTDAADVKAWFDSLYKSSGLYDTTHLDEQANLNVQEVCDLLRKYDPANEDLDFSNENVSDPVVMVARFIQSLGLYETVATQNGGAAGTGTASATIPDRGQVAISTIHGAKGLEWPVVFVPGLCESLLPSKFALDLADENSNALDEERRTLYVASTRARALLYFSYYTETEGKWGGSPITACSRFVEGLSAASLVTKRPSALESDANVRQLYQLLEKLIPPDYSFDKVRDPAAATPKMPALVPEGETGFTTARRAIVDGELSRQTKRPRPELAPLKRELKSQLVLDAFAAPKRSSSSAEFSHAVTNTINPLAGLLGNNDNPKSGARFGETTSRILRAKRGPSRFSPPATIDSRARLYAPKHGDGFLKKNIPYKNTGATENHVPSGNELSKKQYAPRPSEPVSKRPTFAPTYAPR